MASEVSIWNKGMDKIGVARIVDFNQNTKAAILGKEEYPHIRDFVLRSHPWNFAIKRATLALSGTSPNHGFDNAFQLPNDCLRVLHNLSFENIPGQDIRWQVEGDKIVSSENEFKIRYVARISDVSLFDSMFVEALALKIAAEMAYPLVQSRGLAESMEFKFQNFIKQARSADAQEGTPEQIGADLWIQARNRGTSFSSSDY